MRSKKIFALVLLNVTLLATLCVPNLFIHTAQAAVPRPSEYLMVSGEVTGGNSGVLFVLDTKNSWLSAYSLDQNKKIEPPQTPIDLSRAFKAKP